MVPASTVPALWTVSKKQILEALLKEAMKCRNSWESHALMIMLCGQKRKGRSRLKFSSVRQPQRGGCGGGWEEEVFHSICKFHISSSGPKCRFGRGKKQYHRLQWQKDWHQQNKRHIAMKLDVSRNPDTNTPLAREQVLSATCLSVSH